MAGMKQTSTRDEQFWCDDECGMLRVELWTEADTSLVIPEVAITMYKLACRFPLSWRDRIRQAWAALRGELWRDEILLNPTETVRLRNYLMDVTEEVRKNLVESSEDESCGS